MRLYAKFCIVTMTFGYVQGQIILKWEIRAEFLLIFFLAFEHVVKFTTKKIEGEIRM